MTTTQNTTRNRTRARAQADAIARRIVTIHTTRITRQDIDDALTTRAASLTADGMPADEVAAILPGPGMVAQACMSIRPSITVTP